MRSQDKERLFKVDKLGIQEAESEFLVVLYTDYDEWWKLGVYSSRKRALEVLDEIQRQLIGKKGLITTQDKKGIEFIPFTDTVVVYEMPKE